VSKLEDLLRNASERMKLDFEEASSKYETPDDIGEHRQEIVMGFLKGYFPPSYQFGKGEIIDCAGRRSGQVDVVICNAFHPFTVSESGVSLFFSEGVACAIEVKSDLTRKKELERGLKQIKRIKKLQRKPIKGDFMFGSKYDQERLCRIPAVLFGFQAPSLRKLKSYVLGTYERQQIPPTEQIDAAVALDKGMLINIKDPRDSLVIEVNGERKLGLVGLELGEKTLIRFLFHLSHIIPREIRMAPIVQLYTGVLEGKERVRVL